jgi:hypothetical protein
MFSTADIRQQWQLIDSLGCAMLDKAEAGDWQSMPAIEARRYQLITDFFNHRAIGESDEVLACALNHLLHQDEELLAKTRPARDQLAEQMQQISTGKKAELAYRQSAGFGR